MGPRPFPIETPFLDGGIHAASSCRANAGRWRAGAAQSGCNLLQSGNLGSYAIRPKAHRHVCFRAMKLTLHGAESPGADTPPP